MGIQDQIANAIFSLEIPKHFKISFHGELFFNVTLAKKMKKKIQFNQPF